MPRRLVPLVNGEYYHVFNRGVARQSIFQTKRDYERFLLTLTYCRFRKAPTPLSWFLRLRSSERDRLMQSRGRAGQTEVSLICFVLMPNHFHFLLRQEVEEGISRFTGRIANSYTKYFNTKYDRVGPLLQGAFKAVRIETDAQLLHVSRYIHLNPLSAHVVTPSTWLNYPWSSLTDFRRGDSALVEMESVLCQFPSPRAYEQFVVDWADYTKTLPRLRGLTLESPNGRGSSRRL